MFVRSFVRSFVRCSFDFSFARLFVCSFDFSFVRSFVFGLRSSVLVLGSRFSVLGGRSLWCWKFVRFGVRLIVGGARVWSVGAGCCIVGVKSTTQYSKYNSVEDGADCRVGRCGCVDVGGRCWLKSDT